MGQAKILRMTPERAINGLYPDTLQNVINGGFGDRDAVAANTCGGVWNGADAGFYACIVPFLSLVPLVIISIISIGHFVSQTRLFNQLRPRWTKSFLQEETEKDGDGIEHSTPPDGLVWPLLLSLFGIGVVAVEIVQLTKANPLHILDALPLISWVILTLYIALSRPGYSPARLLLFYAAALIHEIASLRTQSSSTQIQNVSHILVALAALVSSVIIVSMPLRPVSSISGPIGKAGFTPSNDVRSPEDSLRLYQYLTVIWVLPLLKIGKIRQLQREDVWTLGYGFQSRRLAVAFRQLQSSTVFRRLIKANCLDCLTIWTISCIEMTLDFSQPMLLHQLLSVMESPRYQYDKQPAAIYAVMMFARSCLAAQFVVLSNWYSRRAAERARSMIVTMVYSKTLTRKAILRIEPQKGTTNDNGSSSDSLNGTTATANGKATKTTGPGKLGLFKELFSFKKAAPVAAEPASTGKVLNMIRSDAADISERFQEWDKLLETPVGAVIATVLIWNLLGPSCFVGISVIILSYSLNAIVVRFQVQWQRRLKVATDARINITSQFVDVIRHLRWYAWQETWLNKVMDTRNNELNVKVVNLFLNLMAYFLQMCAAMLFPVAAFFAYTALAGNELRIDLIFPAISLFGKLQGRMRDFPRLITALLNAGVAMERIEEFAKEPEREASRDVDDIENVPDAAPHISFQSYSCAWPGNISPILKDVNLELGTGLTVVYGPIGSGKTAFLNAILREMDPLDGSFGIPIEMMGYCAQTAWLQSTSIKENILFLTPKDDERYQRVLEACALLPDLAGFTDGDESKIGENGIGLSGGQRARVALARALYSKSRILLLDDPLSALDQHTAEHVVAKAFASDLMADRLVVLVTHRVNLVRSIASQFVEVSEGRVKKTSADSIPKDEENTKHQASNTGTEATSNPSQKKANGDNAPRQFVEEERREHGGIRAKVWWAFVKAAQYWWLLLFASVVSARGIDLAEKWFYKVWGEAYGTESSSSSISASYFPFNGLGIPGAEDATYGSWSDFYHQSEAIFYGNTDSSSWNPLYRFPSPRENLTPWLIVLFTLGVLKPLTLMIYAMSQYIAVYTTSKVLFAQSLRCISGTTLRFYDVTPVGRLLNRVTSDIKVIDHALRILGAVIFSCSGFVVSLLVIALVSPAMMILVIPLMGAFVLVFQQFLPASRNLKRLETVSLSPLYTVFGEVLAGITSVRAFQSQEFFYTRVTEIVDQYQSLEHFFWSVQSWLIYRYDLISAVAIFALVGTAIGIRLQPGLTAFMLINAQTLIQSTHMICVQFGNLQNQFVSVERIVDLLETEQERKGDVDPPASWPKFGADIEFSNVTASYAPDLDPSLKDISLKIHGGCTTAIIGRTGSGKSTLAAALLNIVRADTGTITIDGVSLTNINVNTLRRRVTFVPQEPVLFIGTLRQNLDPMEEFSDDEVEAVLDRACRSFLGGQSWKLDSHVESGGKNFSQGQRQLIGITRAILRRSSIVILDEATASIDLETSSALQQILREELREATVVTIAHRVEAVRDAKYYVVLDAGRVSRVGNVENGVVATDES